MKLYKVLFLIIYIFLITFCFFNNLQSANTSSEISGGLTQRIVLFLEKIFSNANVDYTTLHSLVRKIIGHYLYHVLVGSIGYVVYILFLKNDKKALIISLLVSLILSIINELLQLIPEGRSFEIRDILINFSGFVTGIFICELIVIIKKARKKQIVC